MKKTLLIIFLVIVILIGGGVLYAGYLGLVPGVATLFGSDKPRDLGVKWLLGDYNQAHAKTKVEVKVATGEASPAESIKLTGSHAAQLTLSQEELTAIINHNQPNWKYFPVRDVQVKIASDGSAQIAGVLDLNRIAGYAAATGADLSAIKTVMDKFSFLPKKIPFYFAGRASVTNNVADLNLSQAQLGRINVPQNLISDNQSAINGFFTEQLNAFPGFSVKSANFDGGRLNFNGRLSNTILTYQ